MRQLIKTGVAALSAFIFFPKEIWACVDRDTTIVCLSTEFNEVGTSKKSLAVFIGKIITILISADMLETN